MSEITMRLGGWRSRSYPLKVTIDGREVYKNSTERNLGYYTARFPAVKGKIIKIELTDTSTAQDGFNIVKVTGKKLESETGNKTKGVLEIAEIEFYEMFQ